jgi:hypothetical protein
MDHVQQPVQITVAEFGLDEITAADRSKGSSSDSGTQTVKVVIDNTIERARKKICEEAVQKVLYIWPILSKLTVQIHSDVPPCLFRMVSFR